MGKRGYRHNQAHTKAADRLQDKPKSIKLTDDIQQIISQKIMAVSVFNKDVIVNTIDSVLIHGKEQFIRHCMPFCHS